MKAGFSRIDITPELGAILNGYYRERYADGVISPIYVNTLAFSDGENTALAISLDISEILQIDTDVIRNLVAEQTGLPYEAIFVACIHTHTAPVISEIVSFFKRDPIYIDFFHKCICDSAKEAISDLKDAVPSTARTECKGVTFSRRFRLPDGKTATNPTPGTLVDAPIGEEDGTLQLLKFKREGACDIAVVNFQSHPDTLGGTKICPDWPGFLRSTLEHALCDEADGKGVVSIFFNGAAGDLVTADRFDAATKIIKKPHFGLKHTVDVGRKLAGAVIGMYTFTEPIENTKVFFKQVYARIAVSKGTPQQVALAKEINSKFLANEDISSYEMGLVEARRYLRLENVTPEIEVNLVTVGFGDVAFIGFPGEPFAIIGKAVRDSSPFVMTIPCSNANGSEGYFPTDEALQNEGYEGKSSLFKPGVAQIITETANKLLVDAKSTL